MNKLTLSNEAFDNLVEILYNPHPQPTDELRELLDGDNFTRDREVVFDIPIGSYHKPYTWDNGEIENNINADIEFDLKRLHNKGVVIYNDVLSVMRSVLDKYTKG